MGSLRDDSVRDRCGAWLVRGHLGDEGRELADQPGLLRAHEGLFENLAQRVNRDDLDLSLVLVLEQDVFEVRSRNHDLLDPEFRGCLDLRRDAADGQDLPADAQRAGHRDRLAYRDFLEGADHRRGDGDRGAVALRALPGADELHVDVMIRDVFARVLLDQGGDVLDGLLRDLPESARGDDPSALLRLGRRDLRRDWEDDPAELRDRVVADEHREAVHHAHDRAFRDERLVLLAAFNHAVRDLLFEGPCDALRVEDVLRRDEWRALFLRDIARDPNEAAELAQPEGELAAPTRPALRLSQDLEDGRAVEMGDLAILRDLLRDESHEFEPVLFRVRHHALHVDLVTVTADPRPQRRMHALHGVEVPRSHEDEIAGHGFRLDHRAGGPLALADDGELLLLHGRQQGLLALHSEHVDLVDEQDALVRFVNRTGFDALVGGRLEAAALERVVLHVPEEGARVAAGRVDERRGLVRGVAHEELGHHQVLLAVSRVAARDVDDCRDQDAEQDDLRRFRVETGRRSTPVVGHDHAEADDEEHDRHDHRGLLFASLHRLRLLRIDDLTALTGRHDADLRLVRVLGVVVNDDVLKFVPREEFGHRAGEHRLAGARITDQHDVPLLLRSLPDDLDGPHLPDHLVDEPLRGLDLGDRNERAQKFCRSRHNSRTETSSPTRTRDHLRELCERALDVVARLRRREHPRSAVGFGGSLYVGLLHRHLFSEVRFVREVLDRNVARDLHDGRDPVVEVVERLLPRDVAHREDALGPVEVRFLQQFAEPFLAHDVPDRHVDVGAPVRAVDLDLLLRDFRAQRGDVSIVELVLDESANQARLTDRAFPDEADLDLHSLAVHGSPRTGCVVLTRLRL